MLQQFFRLASALKPFRHVLIVLIVIFALIAVFGFFTSGIYPSGALQVGLSGTLFWALLLSTTDIFRSVPPAATADASWWYRTRRKTVRIFYGALAFLVLLSALVLISTSFKLFSV